MTSNITYWHEWPSNFSNGQSVDGLGSLFQYVNYSLEGSLGFLIILATFIIGFVSAKAFNTSKAFAGTSFVSFLIAILLMRLEMISIFIVITIGMLLAVSLILARNDYERGIL